MSQYFYLQRPRTCWLHNHKKSETILSHSKYLALFFIFINFAFENNALTISREQMRLTTLKMKMFPCMMVKVMYQLV